MANATYQGDLNASTNTSRITRADALELIASANQVNAQLSAQLRHEQHLSAFLRESLALSQHELQAAASAAASTHIECHEQLKEAQRELKEARQAADSKAGAGGGSGGRQAKVGAALVVADKVVVVPGEGMTEAQKWLFEKFMASVRPSGA